MNFHYPEPNTVENQRRVIGIVLFILAVLLGIDMIEDSVEGVEWSHIAIEMSLSILALFGLLYVWGASLRKLWSKNDLLQQSLSEARQDCAKWQAEASDHLQGLGLAIDKQMDNWSLSTSEKDVALLLIKGCSFKEIANFRSTTERTARQQAANVYSKAGLAGRAELAAFFLEDLLQPRLQ
jgi:DNA-binding CsgD family transcriptional regulator